MGTNFALALVVLFMLMAAMFKSLRDSAFVMATLPMAVLGGVAGLRVLDLAAGQTLDLLSMIGFIMLLGMVINNAILLVAQARAGQADGSITSDLDAPALAESLYQLWLGASLLNKLQRTGQSLSTSMATTISPALPWAPPSATRCCRAAAPRSGASRKASRAMTVAVKMPQTVSGIRISVMPRARPCSTVTT